MSAPTTDREFRTVGDARALPDNYVNPYYLEDLKGVVDPYRRECGYPGLHVTAA
jgi:hypothetical protein